MLLIDSASATDVRAAYAEGLATGVTMNPSLVAAEGPREPLDVLADVLDAAVHGPVFYQPCGPVGGAEREVDAALALAPGRIVVKLPAAPPYLPFARRLTASGVTVALTAVYSPAQAVVAASAGCAWVIPYVDRARRLLPDAPPVVAELASVLAAVERGPRILAASLKTQRQVVDTVRQGAHAVTAPLGVLREMVRHTLSDAAVEEFAAARRVGCVRRIASPDT